MHYTRFVLELVFLSMLFCSAAMGFLCPTYGIDSTKVRSLSRRFFYLAGLNCLGILLAVSPISHIVTVLYAIIILFLLSAEIILVNRLSRVNT